MTSETRIRIALGAVLVVFVAALVVFGVTTRSVEEEPEPPPKPTKSGSSIEEEISKTEQKIKDTQKEIEARAQDVQKETEGRAEEGKTPKLSKEVREACEKAKLDLITGTAKGELDKDQRAGLEGVIARQCE